MLQKCAFCLFLVFKTAFGRLFCLRFIQIQIYEKYYLVNLFLVFIFHASPATLGNRFRPGGGLLYG